MHLIKKKRQKILRRRLIMMAAVTFLIVLAVVIVNVTLGLKKTLGQKAAFASDITDETQSEILMPTEAPTEPPLIYAQMAEDYQDLSADAQIASPYAALLDVNNHRIIAGKLADTKIYPASMTKVMTLIVVSENIDKMPKTYTFGFEMLNRLYREEASVAGFLEGETVDVEDLMYGLVLPSGADAAEALAIMVAGSNEEFAKLMNEKCKALGLKYTHFLNDMLPLCDYITIHVPYLPTTKDTINAQTLALCKDGVKILNYARGELVNTAALLEALENGRVSGYMTDFPAEALLGRPGVICTPHLGASTPEAEDNCAVMAAQEISDYLKNGNITHSVNLPEVVQPRAGGRRICIIHKNEPGMISQITALTTEAGLNIENMVNKSKKNMAYTMLDATGAVNAALADKLAAIPAVIRVRIL